MPAYLVGHITIRDADRWQEYVGQVGATIAAGGGELVFRGETSDEICGAAPGRRIVVARFADLAAIRRWHDGPDYQALIPVREVAADVILTAYQD